MTTYKWIYGKAEGFADAAAVRTAVFCQEQGYSREGEFDDIDHSAWHLVGYQSGVPVCTARMYGDSAEELHVGRVAVLQEFRGKGFGREVMVQQEEKALQLGASRITLNAQVARRAFYERLAYAPTGQTSLDEGVPHMEMAKSLSASD